MPKKIGHSLEKLLRRQEREANKAQIQLNYRQHLQTRVWFPREKTSQTYTIECPHCKKFFEFELEVSK